MNQALEEARGVPLPSLERYLVLHGWNQVQNIRNGFDLFTVAADGSAKLELLLPQKSSNADAIRRVSDALRTIAQFEDRDLASLIADVRAVGIDVWRSIVPDALVMSESVRLDVAEEFVKNAKGLLAAAATTESSPKRFFGRVTKSAAAFADDCRFGHTFRGSFGFTIESPIVPNLSPTMPGMEEQAPLERRIMQRIARGVNHIAQAGVEGDPAVIFDNYETGFSANMCEDFIDLMGAVSGQGLGFEFSFSPEWRPAPDIADKVHVDLAPVHVELVKDAARRLRLQDFERNQTVVGRVVRLETDLDPSDLFEQGDREIAIHWISKDFGTIRVRLTLPAEQYLAALAAHGQGRAVSVSGLIDRQGRYWYLRDPTNFSVLG
jgi:hypothetical protein